MISKPMNRIFHKISFSQYVVIIMLLLMSFFFPFFFSAYTSPFYPGFHGADSAIFMTMGRAVVQGKLLYKEIFDIKGPLIFFINALGQFIYNGRFGTFLVQVMFMTGTVLGMYKTARLFISRMKSVAAVFLSLIVMTATYERGNLTEEYCLTFIFPSLYCACRYWKEGKKFHPSIYSLIYGLSMGLLLWTRINNGATVMAITFYIYLTIIFTGNMKLFVKNLLFFLIGLLLISVPIIVLFWMQGSLKEMFYGTFTFLFSYAQAGVLARPAWKWNMALYNVSPAVGFLIVTLIYSRYMNRNLGKMLGFAILITTGSLLVGMNYPHYYMILTPLFLVALSMTLEIISKKQPGRKKSAIANIFALTGIALSVYQNFSPVKAYMIRMYYDKTKPIYLGSVKDYLELAEMIPMEDQDSVWGYNINPAWYYVADILPCFKYFINQEQHLLIDPQMKQEIVVMLSEHPPKWIAKNSSDEVPFIELRDLLEQNYTLVADLSLIRLYHRIGE